MYLFWKNTEKLTSSDTLKQTQQSADSFKPLPLIDYILTDAYVQILNLSTQDFPLLDTSYSL